MTGLKKMYGSSSIYDCDLLRTRLKIGIPCNYVDLFTNFMYLGPDKKRSRLRYMYDPV